MYEILIKPIAELDLEGIWFNTYEEWSEFQANYYLDEIYLAFTRIQNNHKDIGRKFKFGNQEYFRYKVHSHAIFYSPLPNGIIEIVRILHQRMDIPDYL